MAKLLDFNKNIGRGTIFQCKGSYPYEDIVDFMVCETIGGESCMIMVVSGYKAGSPLVVLPKDSVPENSRFGINIEWLKENWNKWVYPECNINDVKIFEIPVPTEMCS